jgi:hypothetical protein
MKNEITALRDRVTALEWALYQLLYGLDEKQVYPQEAFHQAMFGNLERVAEKGALSASEQAAVKRLADGLAGVPDHLPEFLKQFRRAYPPGAPRK